MEGSYMSLLTAFYFIARYLNYSSIILLLCNNAPADLSSL